jgi:glycopeptide antibiotics resistance protein
MNIRSSKLLVFASIALILAVTLYPFSFHHLEYIHNLFDHFYGFESEGLVRPLLDLPLALFDLRSLSLSDLEPAANIVLFVPLGLGLASLLRRQPEMRGYTAFWVTQITGMGLSFFVELLQVFQPSRSSSLTDLFMNSVGALIGFASFMFWKDREAIRTLLSKAHFWSTLFVLHASLVVLIAFYAGRAPHLWTLANWHPEAPLMLGNEASNDRPWEGRITEFFMADESLSYGQIDLILSDQTAFDLSGINPFARYDFGETERISDLSGNLPSLLWKPESPADLMAGQVRLNRNHWLRSDSAGMLVSQRFRRTSAFTIGVALASAHPGQDGPARIVSISQSPSLRNFTFGQSQEHLTFRIRTPFNGTNGSKVEFQLPAVFSDSTSKRVLFTYDSSSLRLFVGEAERGYALALTPENRTTWFVAHLLAGRLLIRFDEPVNWAYTMLYYAFVFIPLGVFLAGLIVMSNKRMPVRMLGLLAGIVLPVLGLQIIMTPTFESGMLMRNVLLSLSGTGCGLLPGFALAKLLRARPTDRSVSEPASPN